MTRTKRNWFVFLVLYAALFAVTAFLSCNVSAEAKQSTLNVSISSNILFIDLLPTSSGTFGESGKAMVSVSTDNFTGYTLSISTNNETSLVSAQSDEIGSVDAAVNGQDFISDSSYNNKWGIKPDQYISVENEVETVVDNSNFLPAPTDGLTLAKTAAANVMGQDDKLEVDSYGFSFGAKADMELPAGTYTGTFVLTVVPNTIVYNVTYDKNTTDEVSNMPSPNPQATTIDGGTPVEDSYVTLSDLSPARSARAFIGWCDEATTTDSETGDDVCSGTTYHPEDTLPVDQTAGPNITLYAIWADSAFSMAWSHAGKCIFDGANDTNSGYISGSECTEFSNYKFIDTGVALYSSANYSKDYEVHFVIDKYVGAEQPDTQSTLFNDKLSSSATGSPYSGKSPGIVVRRSSTNLFEIKSTYTTTPLDGQRIVTKTGENAYAGTDVRIFRINNVIYTSIDRGPLAELQDMNDPAFNQPFGLTAWFGAYPDNVNCTENCTQAKRYLEGELSDMYIKLGDFDESDLHEMTFYSNDGTSDATKYLIVDGDEVATFPEVSRSGWTFGGWWTATTGGSEVTAPYTPTGDVSLYAHWYKAVSEAQIVNDSISLAVNGTEAIQITNSSDLEPFTLVSSDSSVATVDGAGLVTGVGDGVTTITMIGSITGDTKTISVTVGAVITVTFDPAYGSETTFTRSVVDGGSFDSLPSYIRAGYELEGWYTEQDGAGTELTTSTVFGGGTATTYYAHWTAIPYVCKIANTRHYETCTQESGYGCRKAGWAADARIDYGYLITDSSTVTAGAAYDCDVDYDGTYDDETERFYYFGTENGNAKLIHYINQQNNASETYDVAVSYLPNYELDAQNPTIPVWDNPHLVTYDSGTFAGKAARFMTYDEIYDLWTGGSGKIKPSNYTSVFLFENTNFATTGRTDGVWLQLSANNGKNRIQTSSLTLTHNGNTSANASRATIEVPESLIEKYILDVTNAIIANNDLTVLVGGNITIQVSNSASLEPYSFSSADEAIATVNPSTGEITGVSVGTVNIIMTGANSNQTKTLEVDVSSSLQDFTVTFDTNGGLLDDGASNTRVVTDGDEVGTLPTASKTNHRFFGWYTDDGTFYDEVYPETKVDADITYYAKWEEDTPSFPIVWSEVNECTFTGTAVTGSYCSNTNNSRYYIDTNIQLFTATNYNKDFEVGFTITEYDPANQLSGGGNQATFVSSKKEDSVNDYPGFVVRRYSGTSFIEITSRWKGDTQSLVKSDFSYATTKTVKLLKRKETEQGNDYYRIYYSINGGAWTLYEDVTNKTHFEFDTKVWFGGAAAANGTSPMRPLVGKMTDMYVKQGVENEYLVELDANGGTLPSGAQNNYTITVGDPVGALPTPTAPSVNYSFGGWYNGDTLVNDGTQYVPTSNVILVAKWIYNSSDAPVIFDVSNDATRGYKTIINQWAQSPINITTFNRDATINNSTWGDTTELSEVQFWTALRNNFETNNCLVPSYGDAATTTPNPTAWTSGSVDCAKPDEYDTLIRAPLNVYLYNDQTLGAQVSYAEADDGVIRNLIPGNTYKWVKDGDNTIYGYVTVTSNGSNTGTRWVDTGKIRNVRDLGGLPADTDGDGAVDATVNYGRLFRGERLWNAPATELTNLGINKEYDVGDPAEYSGDTKLSDYQFDKVIHYNFDYHAGDEDDPNSNYMLAWTAVTDIMTDIVDTNNPKNIYFHCRVGADRTGTVAYLLEGLLGVPDEERYEEYSLSHLSGLFDRTRYYKQKSSTNNLKFIFMMGYVKTNADILTWYNHNPNADANLINAFKAAMTTSNQ